MGQDGLGRAEGSENVHLDRPLPALRVHGRHQSAADDPRVRHDDVEPPEPVDDLRHSASQCGSVGDVDSEGEDTVAQMRRDGLDCLNIDVEESDRRPVLDERRGEAESEAGTGTGHQRHRAVEVPHAAAP
jgi:hypothetical protein